MSRNPQETTRIDPSAPPTTNRFATASPGISIRPKFSLTLKIFLSVAVLVFLALAAAVEI